MGCSGTRTVMEAWKARASSRRAAGGAGSAIHTGYGTVYCAVTARGSAELGAGHPVRLRTARTVPLAVSSQHVEGRNVRGGRQQRRKSRYATIPIHGHVSRPEGLV